MKKLTHKQQIKTLVGILCIFLAFLIILLYREYRELQRENTASAHHTVLINLLHHGPLAPADADSIESWMTFDYVNFAFKIPANYLKSQLNVTIPQYPRISLVRYAQMSGMDQNIILDQVRNAVRNYSSTSTIPYPY